MNAFVVAVDGPAASGKGTLSAALGERFGFNVLDTGSLYRAVGRLLLDGGHDPADATVATHLAEHLQPTDLARRDLRGETVGQAASICSGHPGVRAALLDFQLNFAAQPPGGVGAILDGRDIGTAVCPNADVKLWITASAEVRARRRYAEALAKGDTSQTEAQIAELIRQRDDRERNRSVSPMVPADDAVIIDSSHLSAGDVLAQAVGVIEARWLALHARPAPRPVPRA